MGNTGWNDQQMPEFWLPPAISIANHQQIIQTVRYIDIKNCLQQLNQNVDKIQVIWGEKIVSVDDKTFRKYVFDFW